MREGLQHQRERLERRMGRVRELLGRALGEWLFIAERGPKSRRPRGAADSAGETFSVGQISVSATVNVSFLIE